MRVNDLTFHGVSVMMRIYGCQFDLTVAPFVCRTELTNKDKNVTLWNIKNINLGLLKLVGFSKAQFVEATCAFCLQYFFLDHPLRWNTKKKKNDINLFILHQRALASGHLPFANVCFFSVRKMQNAKRSSAFGPSMKHFRWESKNYDCNICGFVAMGLGDHY